MWGSIHGSGSPPQSRGWGRLGGFVLLLLLLEGAGGLAADPSSSAGLGRGLAANPSGSTGLGRGLAANPSGSTGLGSSNEPSVNIYMSVEEVKKLLGPNRNMKDCRCTQREKKKFLRVMNLHQRLTLSTLIEEAAWMCSCQQHSC